MFICEGENFLCETNISFTFLLESETPEIGSGKGPIIIILILAFISYV